MAIEELLEISADPRKWSDHAACKYEGPDPYTETAEWNAVWYPLSPREMSPDASAICSACPVRAECEDWVMRDEGSKSAAWRYGIVAGMPSAERAAKFRSRRPKGTKVGGNTASPVSAVGRVKRSDAGKAQPPKRKANASQ